MTTKAPNSVEGNYTVIFNILSYTVLILPFYRPKKLPLDNVGENLLGRQRTKKIQNTDSIAMITLSINEENLGSYYCSLVGSTVLISEVSDGPCKYVFSLVSYNLQRVDSQTISLTSVDKSIELKFRTQLSCLQFYNIVNSPHYAVIPDGESLCGYTCNENSSLVKSRSFEFLQTEVKSPQYQYPRFNTNTKSNLPLNSFKLPKRKLSDQFGDVYNALTQFVSPVYDYVRVFPSPSPVNNRNLHIYETIRN